MYYVFKIVFLFHFLVIDDCRVPDAMIHSELCFYLIVKEKIYPSWYFGTITTKKPNLLKIIVQTELDKRHLLQCIINLI